MNRVISIEDTYVPLLSFIFPTYSYNTDVPMHSIIFKDIKSSQERTYLEFKYSDCIIISKIIFDEVWDRERISAECVNFARTQFTSRKSKFLVDTDSPVESFLKFLFSISEDESHSVVFDSVGSISFLSKFLKQCQEQPYPQLRKAILTFLCKSGTSEDVYYLRKRPLFNKLRGSKYELSYKDTIKEASSMKFAYKLTKLLTSN